MNLERIYKLVDAGFTKDEIMRLMGYKPAPAPDSMLVDTLKQMQTTLQQMQLANIGAADNTPPRSADDIASDFLAAVINPPTANKKED